MPDRRSVPPTWLAWLAGDAPPAAAELASADWPAIVQACKAHHLAPALYSRLRADGVLDQAPADARVALGHTHQRAAIDALVWQRALRLVLPALAADGVEAVPYKGAALAFLLYADPATRSMSDLDLWIDAAQMPAACATMERLGFERYENPARPIALQARYDGEVPYRGRRVGVPLVELHWGVFPGEWLRRTTAIDRDALRRRLRPATLFDCPLSVLAPEDHLLQVAVHAAVTHVFSQAALRCLLDLVTIARAGVDWDVVVERARQWRIASVVGHTLHLTGELFARPEFSAAGARLIAPARLRALSRLANAGVVLEQRRIDSGLVKWRYLTAAVDRDRDRFQLLLRSVWPEREWLGARYGGSTLPVRARHLASAMRGRF